MGRKLTYKFVKSSFEKDDYTLLSKEYKCSNIKLNYKCSAGHKHSTSWDNWKQGKRCPYCDGQVKLTLDFIKSEFKKEGYKLLSTKYKNAHTKLDFICPSGHKHYIKWSNWYVGKRCYFCYGTRIKTIDDIKSQFEKEGYKLLSTHYINNQTKLDYICSKGHKHNINYRSWNSGVRCFYCSNKVQPNIHEIKKSFRKECYILLSKEYINSKTKLDYICPNKHIHSVTWNHWKNNDRCPKCSNNGTSNFEKEVKQFIIDKRINIIENDRTIIKNHNTDRFLELDILLPCKTKAIECNGIYWHDRPEAKEKDKIKQKRCKELGIKLLIITDKEWKLNQNKCKDKINKFLI